MSLWRKGDTMKTAFSKIDALPWREALVAVAALAALVLLSVPRLIP